MRAVSVHLALRAAPALGDTRLIERLISNLIENALRHNIPEGTADVIVYQRDSCATLQVTNTGPIVPADQIERLLEPFQRLDAGLAAEREGQGLGLSIVRAIADVHGASLAIRPQPAGGLDIEIRLPASTPTLTRTRS